MIQFAAAFAFGLMIAAPPTVGPGRPVDTAEALAALKAARAGDEGPADALAGRPFHVAAQVAAADWSYEPTFAVLTYRPRPVYWSGSSDPLLAHAIGLRLDKGAEPLGIAPAPAAFDWFMGGEGLAAVRLPLPPGAEAEAKGSLRLVIDGVIEPLDGRRAVACGAPGEGCILGARIDDLILVYGPESAPHVLARWDPAMEE